LHHIPVLLSSCYTDHQQVFLSTFAVPFRRAGTLILDNIRFHIIPIDIGYGILYETYNGQFLLDNAVGTHIGEVAFRRLFDNATTFLSEHHNQTNDNMSDMTMSSIEVSTTGNDTITSQTMEESTTGNAHPKEESITGNDSIPSQPMQESITGSETLPSQPMEEPTTGNDTVPSDRMDTGVPN
jgi:hypothetical protein